MVKLQAMLFSALVALTIAAGVAHAETGRSDDSGVSGAAGARGLAAPASPSLFSGSMSAEIPIEIPPGRQLVTPEIKLAYNSSASYSPYGYGWTLPLGAIERSTKYGVPRCEGDYSTNLFTMGLAGASGELVYVGEASHNQTTKHHYRLKIDEAYTDVYADESTNTWEAYDRRGVAFVFGGLPYSRSIKDGDVFMDVPNCQFTARWGLTQIRDPSGNVMDIHYADPATELPSSQPPSGSDTQQLYPSEVRYGGNVDAGAGLEHPFEVAFKWVDAPFPQVSYRLGVKDVRDFLLDTIDVRYRPTPGASYSTIRSYQATYDTTDGGGRSLLVSFGETMHGLLPPWTFTYSSDDFGYAETWTGWNPPNGMDEGNDHVRRSGHAEETRRSLLDMNGDGFTDIVEGQPGDDGEWDVWLGSTNGFVQSAITWEIPDTPGSTVHIGDAKSLQDIDHDNGEKKYHLETMDIDGDGLPDLIDARGLEYEEPETWMSDGKWHVYYNKGCSSGTCKFRSTPKFVYAPDGWSPYAIRKVDDDSDTYRDLIDFNGDGLVDLVEGSKGSSCWKIYLNEGKDSNGHIHFADDYLQDYCAAQSGQISVIDEQYIHNDDQDEHRTTRTLMDFNGDSLPDIVKSSAFELAVWDSNGNFLRTVDITYDDDDFRLEGIQPLAAGEYYTAALSVKLNTGSGFGPKIYSPSTTFQSLRDNPNCLLDTEEPGMGNPVAIEDYRVCYSFGSQIVNADQDLVRSLMDVNGDGLPDLVAKFTRSPDNAQQWKAKDMSKIDQWSVLLNVGGGRLERRTLNQSARPLEKYDSSGQRVFVSGYISKTNSDGETTAEIVDFNGDGLADRIRQTVGSWTIEIAGNLEDTEDSWSDVYMPPGMLTGIDNGLYKTTHIRYRPSTHFYYPTGSSAGLVPFVNWVVSDVLEQSSGVETCTTANDADFDRSSACVGSGQAIITSYQYADAEYDAVEREFRGFGKV